MTPKTLCSIIGNFQFMPNNLSCKILDYTLTTLTSVKLVMVNQAM